MTPDPTRHRGDIAEPASGVNKPILTAIAMLVGVFSGGITTLVGGIMAYVFRGEVSPESWEHSHYAYHIRTFWGSVILGIVGVVLTLILIGFVVLALAALWIIARSVTALMKANERQPMPNPDSWLL